MKKILSKLENYFFPHGLPDVCKAVLGSFLVAYLLVTRIYYSLYQQQVEMPELFSGTSVFKNYNKPADFLIPRYFIILFVLGFFAISFIINIYNKKRQEIKTVHVFAGICLIFIGVKKYLGADMHQEIIYLMGLVLLIIINEWKSKGNKDTQNICANEKRMEQIAVFHLLVLFAVRLCLQICVQYTQLPEAIFVSYYDIILIAEFCLSAMILIAEKMGKLANLRKTIILLAQAVLCFFPVLFWQFHVVHQGNIHIYKFTKLQIFVVFLILTGLVCLFRQFFVKKELYSFWTFVVIAMMQLPFTLLGGSYETINLFHNGELLVPMQQLDMFHKIPYIDFFPIHGICDYYFQFLNIVLFDGTYGAFSFVFYVGSVLLCGVIAGVFYKCIDRKDFLLIFIVAFSVIGEWYYYFRFVFVLPILLCFFNQQLKSDVFKTIRFYVISSIISIAWYPAIGGTLAIALLPIVLYRCLNQSGRECISSLIKQGEWKKELIRMVPMLVIGVAFIPMFFGILRYLKENMSIANYFPGDQLSSVVESSVVWRIFWAQDFWRDPAFLCFSFMIPMILLAIYVFSKEKHRKRIDALTVIIIFAFMICSYTFGTIFAGERALIVTVVLCAFVGYLIWIDDEQTSKLLWGCLIFAMTLNSYKGLMDAEQYFQKEEASEAYVQVNGADIGYPHMGISYMSLEEKETMQNIAFVINELCKEDTFVDFTNQPALYLLLGKEEPFSYTSLYHGTGVVAQKNMLAELKESSPHVVLVSPYWHNEGGTVALKHKEIYQYFMNHGYMPYVYNNVCFLTDLDMTDKTWAGAGGEYLMRIFMENNLNGLPITWGDANHGREEITVDSSWEIVNSNSVEYSDAGKLRIVGDDPYVVYNIDGADIYEKGEYLKVAFWCDALEEYEENRSNMTVYFSFEDAGYNEAASLTFKIKNGEMLVPLYAYPLWTEMQPDYLRIDINDERLSECEFELTCELVEIPVAK